MNRNVYIYAATAAALAFASAAAAKNWGDWGTPVNLESLPGSSAAVNTPAVDGCASHSQDGLSIVFNSNRGGGNQDLYMATRSSTFVGFGTPERLPAPVNTSANEACPTIANGHRLYFSSDRDDPAYDMYVSKRGPNGWSEPQNLGPNINTAGWLDEAAAFYEDGGDQIMLFSSRQVGGSGDGNIYQSVNGGPKSLVAGGANSSASDNRPSVTRDGLIIFFDSTRSGALGGGPDIYYATRSNRSEPFGPAIHLVGLSSSGFDARATISKDGSFLTFSSARPGAESAAPDIFYTTRDKITGQ